MSDTIRRAIDQPTTPLTVPDDVFRITSADGAHWLGYVGELAKILIGRVLTEHYVGGFGDLWVRVIAEQPTGYEEVAGRPTGMDDEHLIFGDLKIRWWDMTSIEI